MTTTTFIKENISLGWLDYNRRFSRRTHGLIASSSDVRVTLEIHNLAVGVRVKALGVCHPPPPPPCSSLAKLIRG